MKRKIIFSFCAVALLFGIAACGSREKVKDRSDAGSLYQQILSLTEEYTKKISAAGDSASWAILCAEYEDRLDKVNFSFPSDTDLLLTEGQNDTITDLIMDFIKIRDERIESIMHPVVVGDSISQDSVAI